MDMDRGQHEATDILVATEGEAAKFAKIYWVWCTVCGGGSLCKSGRRHKGDTGHETMSLKKGTRSSQAIWRLHCRSFCVWRGMGKLEGGSL